MILAFDIGNTNIKVALCEKNSIVHQWRISKDSKRTGDEYFSILRPLFRDAGINFKQIDDVVMSTVVPALTGPFVNVSQNITGKKPFIVEPSIYKKLPVKVPSTAVHEIGTDLLCDAVAAWEAFKGPCIVADFGTALSFTAVDKNANIAGIAIAPGIRTAFNSLFANTAQIPAISLDIPRSSLGKNTVESVQSGIVLGYKGLVESMIQDMKEDMQKESRTETSSVKVMATGGLNSMLAPITEIFDCIDKELTIKGLLKIKEYCSI